MDSEGEESVQTLLPVPVTPGTLLPKRGVKFLCTVSFLNRQTDVSLIDK